MGAALLLGCDLGKPTHSVNIGFSGDGSGQVRSTSPRFDCSGQCRQSVEANSTIELTAVPADGSAFAGWQGACSGSGTCTVMLDADRQVTASFSIVPRTSCTGIAPPDDRAMQQYPLAGGDDFVGCGNAVGDETGGLAFVRNYDNPNLHADSLDFFLPAMNRSVGWGMAQGVGAFQQPVGVSAVSVNPYLGPVQVRGYLLQNFDAAARSNGYAFVYGGELTVVSDPSGGILFAGDLVSNIPTPVRSAHYVSPGLIDLQVNGSDGIDVMRATSESLLELGHCLAREGTTAWLPTAITSPLERIEAVAANISLVMSAIDSQTKVFTDPPTAIQQERKDVSAAKNIPNSEKKKLLRSLTLALRAARNKPIAASRWASTAARRASSPAMRA